MRSNPGPDFNFEPTRPVTPMPGNSPRSLSSLPVWSPPTDVVRTERELVVRLELAGTPASEIAVRVGDSELIVSGRRRDPLGPRLRRVDRMEIPFGRFERVIPLPVPIDADRSSAHLEDGFLLIVLPLAESWATHSACSAIHL